MNVRTIVLILSLFSLISTATGGYLYYQHVRESALKDAEIELVATNEALRDDVVRIISFNQAEVKALAGFEQLRGALVDPQKMEALLRANRVLDNFAKGFAYDVCFLIDSLGNTIASSNRNQPDSFVGVNYHFRKYFQDAIQGRPSVEMALGVTTGIRGIFVSHPVYLPDDAKPIGVVVIKVSTRDMDRVFLRTRNMDTLLVNNDGMIFASNRRNWILNRLWKLSPEELERIRETKQFGKGPWNWTGLEKKADNQVLDSSGADYTIGEMSLENYPGWKIVYLYSLRSIYGKIVNPLVGKTGYLALVLCLLFVGAVIVLYVMAQSDITERKRVEDALRDSESYFRSMTETTPDALVVYDNIGRVTFVNKAFEELYGWSMEELIGKRLENFVPPTEEAITKQTWKRTLQGENVVFETQRWAKERKVLDISMSTAMLRNIDGEHTASIVIHHDITTRKREKEELLNSERMLKTILATSPAGILLIADRKVKWLNDACLKMFGFENQQEIVGQNTRIVYPSQEEYERVGRELYTDLQSGKTVKTVTRFRRKDGSIFDGRIRMTPVDLSSSENLMIFVITDISDELRAEREKEVLRTQLFQSQKMEALGTLVGGIAHDFNNMLQSILGYSEMLLIGKKKDDPVYKELQTIIQVGRGGAELVKKLLALGQQGQVIPVPLDLNYQISQLTTLISHTLPQVVQLDVDLFDGPTTIHADHSQTDQIIMNLAINASEAMPDGGRLKIATTTVSLDDKYCRRHNGAKPGSYVMLSVKDTGRGMDKETLARIFDPFFSTKQRGSARGTGLGLSVVQGIVQQHGGHVTCESESGKGTEFKVYFPAIKETLIAPKTVAPTVECEGTETILVVEDNIPVAELERTTLEDGGYTVIMATNGQEALDIYEARSSEISLVILDLIMPEMSGKDCLMELVKIDPSVKVLIASGYAPEDELHKEISPLVTGFLHKPFAMVELLTSVRSVVIVD
ncbi:MAG: PAS domain S-box protein [Desulfomonilaceae bacterium]